MNQLLNISFRNLARQKRRSFLLGLAIAFGAMVLILSSAFSHGISKVLFEQIVRYTNGHVAISYMRNGNIMNQVFHDDGRIREALTAAGSEVVRSEEAIGIFGRAIGNGAADNVIMVGVDIGGTLSQKELQEFQANFRMLQGSFLALNDKSQGIPVVLAEQKAKYLNVKLGDALRVRYTGITNQTSSANLVVAGIFKPANVFMSSPIFLEIGDIRKLAGYGPHDLAGMQITLNDPQRTAKQVADRIHDALKPGLAAIPGTATLRGKRDEVLAIGFRTDSTSLQLVGNGLSLASGDSARSFGYQGVILAGPAAARLGARAGDTLEFQWKGRYDTLGGRARWVVSGILADSAAVPGPALLVNERAFYNAYYSPLPQALGPEAAKSLPDSLNRLWPALAPEFLLLKRCATTEEYTKIIREMGRAKFKGTMVSVQSMYETASMIVNLERALNLITLSAVMVLFFIILIGVINTLRMSIRERTREIGTVRAIGMQKGDVRTMFILETGFLAFLASMAGMAAAFLVMWGLSAVTIEAGDNPLGMLLVNNHLFFAPTLLATMSYVALIVAMAVGTAFFPARRAANLPAAAALRHYE